MELIKGKLIDYYYLTTKEELDECVSLLETKDLLLCDTETYPLYSKYGDKANWRDPHTSAVRLWQVNFKGNKHPYIVDLFKIGYENCKSLISLLTNKLIRKVYHNSIFDNKMLKSSLGVWHENIWCTLVLARRINVCTGFRAGQMRGNSLKALARDYLALDLSKTEQASDWSNPNLSSEQLEYAALDVGSEKTTELNSVLGYLYDLFTKTLYSPYPNGFGGHCKLKDYKEPIEVDQAANAILAEIEYTGMPVSVKMLDLIYNTASKELEILKHYLCTQFNLPLQQTIEYTADGPQLKIVLPEKTEKALNSPKQLVELVNKVLKSQGIFIDNVKAESLKEVLNRLKLVEESDEDIDEEEYYEDEEHDAEWGIELIDKLVKYKELAKLVSIDYRKLINPVTGRIHSSYQCIGASTGRMSSGGKGAFNAQNISTKSLFVDYYLNSNPYTNNFKVDENKLVSEKVTLRNAFVVDKPGIVFASADFSA